jgi:SPOR domain
VVGNDDARATLGSALLNAVMPATVTAIGGLIVAWYTQSTQAHDQRIEDARATASASSQADQEAQAVRAQNRSAQVELLRDLAPRVVGSTASAANCPLVLGLWESVYPGTPAPVLSAACPLAANEDAGPVEQHWGVAIGSASSEAFACTRSGVVRDKGFPVAIYRTGHRDFQAVAGYYSSKSEAEPVAAALRVALHLDALVVRIDPKIAPYYKFQVCSEGAGDAGDGREGGT